MGFDAFPVQCKVETIGMWMISGVGCYLTNQTIHHVKSDHIRYTQPPPLADTQFYYTLCRQCSISVINKRINPIFLTN